MTTLKVKLTYPYESWPLARQTPGQSLLWENIQFLINPKEDQAFDYWVVFSYLPKKESTLCHPQNTLFLTTEPQSIYQYNEKFLGQFNHVISCQKQIKHPHLHLGCQGHPWFIEKSYDELIKQTQVEKTKKISVITSNKAMNAGHRKRMEFCLKLKERFKDKIDLFGRGIQSFDKKWDVLAPYEYSVAIENDVQPHWFTEKLYDCFLTHTVPLYYGCPNISEYFEPESMISIDINDFKKTIEQIDKILSSSDLYKQKLSSVIAAKEKYLNEYNLFPLITKFINQHHQQNHKIELLIKPESDYTPVRKMIQNLKSYVKKGLR